MLIPPPLPDMYTFLPGFNEIQEEPPHGIDPHLVFFFDSGNLERSGSSVKKIASQATIVNVDHHPSNSRFGDINVIEPDAAAVGQIVMRMLDHFGFAITPTIATKPQPIAIANANIDFARTAASPWNGCDKRTISRTRARMVSLKD